MGEYLFQTVPLIAYTDPTSNCVESHSSPSDTLDTQPPPYTGSENAVPEEKKKK